MNKFIEKVEFKKIVIIYLILLMLTIISLTIFLVNVYKEKIKIIYNYHQLTEIFEGNYNKEKLYNKITNLQKSSKDIIDIVVINKNDIIYTSNKIYQNNLTSINNSNKYYTDSNNIYKLDTKKEFIYDLLNIKKETKENYYNEFQLNNDSNYTINYLKNRNTNEKIIIITNISLITNSEKYLKISLSIIILFFMLYWIIVSLMIYQNALRLKINAFFWGIITLLTNIIGVIIYLIYIKNRIICKNCHTNISIKDQYCKGCGEKI